MTTHFLYCFVDGVADKRDEKGREWVCAEARVTSTRRAARREAYRSLRQWSRKLGIKIYKIRHHFTWI